MATAVWGHTSPWLGFMVYSLILYTVITTFESSNYFLKKEIIVIK